MKPRLIKILAAATGSIYSIILCLSMASCNTEPEIADIKIDNADPRLVVEAVITDQPGPYTVKLSMTRNFYDKETKKVNDAQVTITDSNGNKDVLTNTSEGIFQTDSLVGIVGATYYLTINYQGQSYTATSLMSEGITIDSLNYQFQEETLVFSEGFYVTLFGKEDDTQDNFYRWYVFENDTLDKDIVLGNDEFLNPDIKDLMIERAFKQNSKAKIEVHSLSKEAYKYYSGLNNVIRSDGGFFSSPPKNPEGNISNGALGIFRASKVSSAEIEIK